MTSDSSRNASPEAIRPVVRDSQQPFHYWSVRAVARRWYTEALDRGGRLDPNTAWNECAVAICPPHHLVDLWHKGVVFMTVPEVDYKHAAAAELLSMLGDGIIEIAPGRDGAFRYRLEFDPFDARGCWDTRTREAVR